MPPDHYATPPSSGSRPGSAKAASRPLPDSPQGPGLLYAEVYSANQEEKARHRAFSERAENDIVRHYIDKKRDPRENIHKRPFNAGGRAGSRL